MEDLRERRKLIEYTTIKTVGTFGRPPRPRPPDRHRAARPQTALRGFGPAVLPQRRRVCPEHRPATSSSAGRLERDRRRGAGRSADQPRAGRSDDSPGTAARRAAGVPTACIVRGAKLVGSISAQANEIIFTNLAPPRFPARSVYLGLRAGSDRRVSSSSCRERVSSKPGADPFDHPIAAQGRRNRDQFIIFEDVFVPNDRALQRRRPGAAQALRAGHRLGHTGTSSRAFGSRPTSSSGPRRSWSTRSAPRASRRCVRTWPT